MAFSMEFLSPSGLLVRLTILAPILFILTRSIYYLYFHPLANYPGPKLWAISRLPWHLTNLGGNLAWRIRDLHAQYGPVIRIAPDELSYTTSTAWRKIYGQTQPTEFLKCFDGRGIAPAVVNGNRSIATELPDRHAMLRRAILPAFSERALRDQEDYFQLYAGKLVAQLRRGQGPQNITRWLNLASFDIMSDLAFGQAAGCLDRADQPWLEVIGSRVKSIVWCQLAAYYGIEWVLDWMAPKKALAARKKHRELTWAKVKRRIDQQNSGERSNDKDFMSYIMENGKQQLTNQDLYGLASALIVAGSNTAAYAMSALVFFVCKDPRVYARLTEEVRTAFSKSDDITMTAAGELRYLRATIDETLRISPPTPSALPRFVPGKGEVIEGKWVPGGMAVGVHNLAAGHASWNFHRPLDFLPERWLHTAKDSPFAGDDRAASQPFSYGRHDCIGQNMAMNEMRLMIAKLFFNFDISLAQTSGDWWVTQKSYLIWEKKPLMVNVRPRLG